ncbi:MAG: hypothetical protein OQK46_00890 [Gammaproteobacteria bacterium]|nr:hypothetical protein [Gammaproteobacteria bacterium]
MRLSSAKQLPTNALIIYMISALLFLCSIELHIHTGDTAINADHGSAVSITSLANNLDYLNISNEIEVSPDGMLKIKHSAPNILVIFLVLTLICTLFLQILTLRSRDQHLASKLPFFGTPALRGPPLQRLHTLY